MAIDYKKEGRIAIFTINRPEAMNSMNLEVNRDLHEMMGDFRDDPELWVGIITGAGEKAFCAGADIKELLPFMKEHRDKPWAVPTTPMRGLELWKPLIAAINGYALGGGLEIALACDIRIASDNAKLGLTEVTLGLMPGWGGTQRLPRIIPFSVAAEMMIMGKRITAQEALEINLVHQVVEQKDLMATAKERAAKICESAPLAVAGVKQAMIRGYSMTLEEGLQLETELGRSVMVSKDFAEGRKAFMEKRTPEYKGE